MTATPSQIASRTAAGLLPGQTAYLGPGLPRLIADHLAPGEGVLLLDDESLLAPPSGAGACILEQSDAAGFVRGGYLDVAVLQARQVSISGDLSEPTTVVPGPTRSAEMGLHARRVVAVVELDSATGTIVERCESAAVRRRVDTIISDVGVFTVTPEGLALSEVAPGWTSDGIRRLVWVDFAIRPDVREMEFSVPAREPHNKVFSSAADAVADIPDGSTVLIDGFGGPGGMAQYLMLALRDHGAKQLTMVSNTAGIAGAVNFGTPPGMRTIDHSILVVNGQIKKAIASFPVSPSPSRPTAFELAYRNGDVELELVPQGTLAERLRAGGFGLFAFYTPHRGGHPDSRGQAIQGHRRSRADTGAGHHRRLRPTAGIKSRHPRQLGVPRHITQLQLCNGSRRPDHHRGSRRNRRTGPDPARRRRYPRPLHPAPRATPPPTSRLTSLWRGEHLFPPSRNH